MTVESIISLISLTRYVTKSSKIKQIFNENLILRFINQIEKKKCSGDAGRDGAIGLVGVQGDDGIDGVDGLPGRDGLIGETGDTGPAGIKGPAGDNGKDGRKGLLGEPVCGKPEKEDHKRKKL